MKKIFAILAMAVSTGAFAASAQLEYQDIDGKNGTSNASQVQLTVKEQINSHFAGDVAFSNQVKDGTKTLSSRTEAGLTGTLPVAGVNLYTRAALGEKFTGTDNFGYYSVEPGAIVPFGKTGLSARVGYRFRTAFNDAQADTTRTARVGLAYDITPKDQIGVRYDRMRGDSNSNAVAVNYTRGF